MIAQRTIGRLADGRVVREHTLANRSGARVSLIELGAIVTSMRVPDRAGRVADVVLGFADLADYETRNPNFGVVVGRYANRIAGARFALDGREHRLDANEGPNTLHGGAGGFGKRLWRVLEGDADALASGFAPLDPRDDALTFALTSEDGDQGFPGRLEVRVRCALAAEANDFRIDYRASVDRATVVNLSHHGYFNLAGSGDALGQRLTIAASRYLEVDAALIPTRIAEVAGSPFDFRAPERIDARLRDGHPQLVLAGGYDHCFVLDRAPGGLAANARAPAGLAPAARLEDEASGRVLAIETTEPALQFYSGNFLDGRLVGRDGRAYRQGDGVCLEPQRYPDAPNRADFPSAVLRPGEVYASTSVYRFGVAG